MQRNPRTGLFPFLLFLAALPALPAWLPAQGTPFKSEVDGLIRAFRTSQHENHALGDGTCLQTAKILTAMGHCHRFYSSRVGPVVRRPINFMFGGCRQADGSFSDGPDSDAVEITLWVMDALRILDPEMYQEDLEAGKAWLRTRTKQGSAFDDWTAGDVELQNLAKSVRRGLVMSADGKPDMQASVQALLALVKAQMRHRGKTGGKTGGKPTPFSRIQEKGFAYLLSQQEEGKFFIHIPVGKDGGSRKVHDLGITGMGLAALQTKPRKLRSKEEQKVIDQGLAYVLGEQNKDGSFGKTTVNYVTCAAVMALSKAEEPKSKEVLKRAQRYILAIQNIDDRGYNPSDRDYGSIGYGGDERGDLSNLQMAVEALKSTGLDDQDEAYVKALVFLQRVQNLREVNDFEGRVRDEKGNWHKVGSGDDGGAAYYPGNSPAGYITLSDGTKIPRSYGSMTYALLKTYTLCGLPPEDPRIQAAVHWIQSNWNLEVNPGSDPKLKEKVKYQGLYYYYMVLAQALDIAGIEQLEVPAKAPAKAPAKKPEEKKEKEGKEEKKPSQKIDWRQELKAKLTALQRENGAWLNHKNDRWFEGLDVICSVYAMLALERCR